GSVLDAYEEERGADRTEDGRRDLAAADAPHGRPRAASVERVDEPSRRLFAQSAGMREDFVIWHGVYSSFSCGRIAGKQVACHRLTRARQHRTLPGMDGLTPIRRQYLDVKRRYPHAI